MKFFLIVNLILCIHFGTESKIVRTIIKDVPSQLGMIEIQIKKIKDQNKVIHLCLEVDF